MKNGPHPKVRTGIQQTTLKSGGYFLLAMPGTNVRIA